MSSDNDESESNTLRDMTRDEKLYFLLFFIIQLWNYPGYHHVFKSTVYSYWVLCIKLKYSEYILSYTILQYEVYWDPDKGKLIVDSVITTTPIASIFLKIFYVLNVPLIYVNIRKFVEKNVHRGCNYMYEQIS